jgi:hypothetical protein
MKEREEMATTTELIDATGVQVVTDQDFDLEVPVLAGTQRQGDVLVKPATVTATTPVPASGTPVVRGENGGNTHAIYAADGPVFVDVTAPSVSNLRVATLSVPEGSTAYLGHPEHGYAGIAPGDYEIRRQREQAEQQRMVAD